VTIVPDANLARIIITAAVVLLAIGATAAWASNNATKRLAALLVAQIGALIAWAALGAPLVGLVAGIAMAFAQLAVGAAVLVRLQEAYGTVEVADLDAADASREPEPTRGE
jgi:hypothetical protein